jgi:ADP-ribosylglycohydrolase
MECDLIADWLKQFGNKSPQILDRVVGIIYGCAIGDCLGVQAEGISKEDIDKYFPDGIKDLPSKNVRGIVPGDWTDDTDQMILLMDVLCENKCNFNASSFAEKLLKWKNCGFKELGDIAGMGIGQLTARCMCKPSFVRDPYATAVMVYKELGSDRAPNGAVMRCGISAVSKNWQETAINQARVTHADGRSIYSSWFITAICRNIINNVVPDLNLLYNKACSFMTKTQYDEFLVYKNYYESDDVVKNIMLGDMEKQGYTLKTLGCGIYAVQQIIKGDYDYKTIQLKIVNQGGDADTNAAVSGMVLGAYLGYSRLPKDWISQLKHKDWLDKKIIKFLNSIGEL